ncbi:hypothetical protein DPMN_014223 [Dreissena polymorpha]|uniref:Uncharacterized protein n=1 Tax=Dreissena polymorpha TaxID=45954 RepID=A0A9D4N8R9_DREPO|nr:hypothetical protein DPMN_014223 [Dreissena polymorpha]
MTFRIIHYRQLTDAFEVRTGVRQGSYSHLSCSWWPLGNEDIDGEEPEWNSVDALETFGRPRLCR